MKTSMVNSMKVPVLSRLLLLDVERVQERLSRLEAAGLVERAPNPWQLTLGILRMWHRLLFRSETVGTCSDFAVRSTWRARLLRWRALRFPFLMAERAVSPWDLSGLFSSTERVKRHLLGAHHDGVQFVYDFELLAADRAVVEEVLAEARAVVEGRHPRGEWLRDLVVYERYHDNLMVAAEAALAGELDADFDDPDLTLAGYLQWCARQPATPAETLAAWRDGAFTLSSDPASWQALAGREVAACN